VSSGLSFGLDQSQKVAGPWLCVCFMVSGENLCGEYYFWGLNWLWGSAPEVRLIWLNGNLLSAVVYKNLQNSFRIQLNIIYC
jgi:hypothetical protein